MHFLCYGSEKLELSVHRLEKPFVRPPVPGSVVKALLRAASPHQLQVLYVNYVSPSQKEQGMHHEGVINGPAAARSPANGIMNYTGS